MKEIFLSTVFAALILSLASTAKAQASGTVVAWGDNRNGQTTVPVAAQSDVTAIAAGLYHTAALRNDGSVVAWGWNYWGETTVPVAAQTGVTAIAAGGLCDGDGCTGHTVALKNDGTVIEWGYGDPSVPADLNGVTAIAAGGSHTVALKNDGSVVAWGRTNEGQTTVPVAALSGVTAIAAGYAHTVALKNDGTVLAWGLNNYGQTTVPIEAQGGVTAIAAGGNFRGGHTVALKSDGTVVAWGENGFGQANVPLGLSGIRSIGAGWYHTVALRGLPPCGSTLCEFTDPAVSMANDGTVVAWGLNNYGQTTVPTGLIGVTAIAAGGFHTVALLGTVLMRPSLISRPSGNELILSWSTNAVGFTLQSTLHLTPPFTWADVTNAPALLGAQWTVTNTFSGSAQFYRLRKL